MRPRSAPVGMVRAEPPRAKATRQPDADGVGRQEQAERIAELVRQPGGGPEGGTAADRPAEAADRPRDEGRPDGATSGAGDGLDDIARGGRLRRRGRTGHRALGSGTQLRLATVGDRDRRGDEAVEQRVRALGPALELGVELAGHEPRVVLRARRSRRAGRPGDWPLRSMPACLERLAVAVVDLEAVAMPLVDDLLAVDRGGLRAGRQPAPGTGPAASCRPCPPCPAGRA